MSYNNNSGSTTLISHNSSAASNGKANNPANSLSLEPNPFEQSFAKNDSLASSNSNSVTNINNAANNGAPQIHLPAGSPAILTPGGRRHILPPLHTLSPNTISNNIQMHAIANGGSNQNPNSLPETPGLMWSSIINNNSGSYAQQSQQQPNQQPGANHQHQPLNQYNQRRTGLTPNESNMRTGLTPGGSGFLSSIQLPGLNTPSSLLNIPSLTPGLGPLLEMSNMNQGNNTVPQNQTKQAVQSQQHMQLQQDQTNQSQQQQQHHPQVLPAVASVQPQQHSQVIPTTKAKVKREAEKSPDLPAKKQRGRKSKATLAAEAEAEAEAMNHDFSNTGEESSANEKSPSVPPTKRKKEASTEEDKRKSFLERNRVAASKCRQRKKQLVNKMKEELNFYSSEHSTLSNQVNTLREQVITLRTILFAHKECPSLLENVGGYDTLNTILNATNYASQIQLQQPLEPTIVPHTTTIAPIEEQNKLQQALLTNNAPSIAAAAAVAVTTNNALNQLHHNHPHQNVKKI